MSDLRKSVIKLASAKPELRGYLLPLLRQAGWDKQAGVALLTPEITSKVKSLLSRMGKLGWPVRGLTPKEWLFRKSVPGPSRVDWPFLLCDVGHWDPAGLIEMYGSDENGTGRRRLEQIAARYGKTYTTEEDLRETVLKAQEEELKLREAQAKKVASSFPPGIARVTVNRNPNLNANTDFYGQVMLEVHNSYFFGDLRLPM